MLAAGSPSLTTAYPNTCAGIKTKRALSGVVMLKETSSGFDRPSLAEARPWQTVNGTMADEAGGTSHLEIVAGDPADPARTGKVDLNDTSRKYGFYGRVGGRRKVKMM